MKKKYKENGINLLHVTLTTKLQYYVTVTTILQHYVTASTTLNNDSTVTTSHYVTAITAHQRHFTATIKYTNILQSLQHNNMIEITATTTL